MNKKKFIFILLIIAWNLCFSQDRFISIENKLNELENSVPGLIQKVDLSVTNVSLQEFITGLAVANNLNISIDNNIKYTITNNFSNVSVKDVLLFLIRKYDLEINFLGSILSISPYKAPEPKPEVIVPRKLSIIFEKSNNLLNFDLKEDSLYLVAKEISERSGINIALSPSVRQKTVTSFVKNTPFEKALDLMAYSNELNVTKNTDGFYYIDKVLQEQQLQNARSNRQPGQQNGNNQNSSLEYSITEGSINLTAQNIPLGEVIYNISSELKKNFFLFSEPKGNTTLTLNNASYDQFLGYILNGSELTFKIENGIYLIGDRNLEGLRNTTVVQLQNRTVDKLIDFIPPELKKGVDVKLFPELNSIILSGSSPRISEIEAFIRSIDRVVPVIMIEVIIVDIKRNKTIATGISAGISDEPVSTGGKLLPEVDFKLDARALNSIINSFNGFGLFNLGNVTPNFYVSLKALENLGYLNIRSTPKLATLNGHEARMSIGRTEYYLEIQNNVIGAQNPQNIISQQYKSLSADLAVTINPIVSGDDQITLSVQVVQSDFTARINPNAPPGLVKRDFSSLIRVKNGEMVILGGLEEEGNRTSTSGLPFLSRIPVIRWIFGQRTKEAYKSRLSIFIKPTIIM